MVNVGFIQNSVKCFKNWIDIFTARIGLRGYGLFRGSESPGTKIIPKFYYGLM